jgi:deoxyribose-phosphate aldolase
VARQGGEGLTDPAAGGAAGAAGDGVDRALAARIDHTLLRADAGEADVLALCDEAARHGFHAVCVNPAWVRTAAARVAAPVRVCSVAGFPLGAGCPEIKAAEAARAIEDGAHEVDMVLAIGRLLAALPAGGAVDEAGLERVADEIRIVGAAVHGARSSVPPAERVLKVILETALLGAPRIARAARLAADAGADYVKTSTGLLGPGADVETVRALAAALQGRARIKASGGIRTRAQALALVQAGADRLGASASLALVRAG